jgi:photosystem II stability/assembly factor-like uncharacterized protein
MYKRRSVLLVAIAGAVALGVSALLKLGSGVAPSASRPPYTPPGSMALFVDDQPTRGEGWRILGGAPNLRGPQVDRPTIELYTGGGVLKPLDALGLDAARAGVDPTRDVIAVGTIAVGDEHINPGCARIRLSAPELSQDASAVILRYDNELDPSATTPACPAASAIARFMIALSIDHLPRGPFSISLAHGGTQVAVDHDVSVPASVPPDAAAAVDAVGTFPKGGLWLRAGPTVWMSTDGARSWRSIGLPDLPIDLEVVDESTLWTVSPVAGSVWPYGGNGEQDVLNLVVARTADGGATWQSFAVGGNFGGEQPVIRFANSREGYLLCAGLRGGQGSRLLVTSDGGAMWDEIPFTQEPPAGNSVPGTLGAVFAVGPDRSLWAGSTGDAGPVARPILDVSRDGGRTWLDARLPGLVGDTSASDHVLAAPTFFGDDGVVAVGVSGDPSAIRIYRTADGGRMWTRLADRGDTIYEAAIAAPSRRDWLVAARESLSGTNDAGETWQTLPAEGLPHGIFEGLAFADPNSGIALVAVGDGEPPRRLYATRDGGRSWNPLMLPPSG